MEAWTRAAGRMSCQGQLRLRLCVAAAAESHLVWSRIVALQATCRACRIGKKLKRVGNKDACRGVVRLLTATCAGFKLSAVLACTWLPTAWPTDSPAVRSRHDFTTTPSAATWPMTWTRPSCGRRRRHKRDAASTAEEILAQTLLVEMPRRSFRHLTDTTLTVERETLKSRLAPADASAHDPAKHALSRTLRRDDEGDEQGATAARLPVETTSSKEDQARG